MGFENYGPPHQILSFYIASRHGNGPRWFSLKENNFARENIALGFGGNLVGFVEGKIKCLPLSLDQFMCCGEVWLLIISDEHICYTEKDNLPQPLIGEQ